MDLSGYRMIRKIAEKLESLRRKVDERNSKERTEALMDVKITQPVALDVECNARLSSLDGNVSVDYETKKDIMLWFGKATETAHCLHKIGLSRHVGHRV